MMHIIILLSFFAPSCILAQDLVSSIEQISKSLKERSVLAMRVDYRLYDGHHSSAQLVDNGQYHFARDGKHVYAKQPNGTEYLNTGDVLVIVDNANMNIIVDTEIKLLTSLPTIESQISQLVKFVENDYTIQVERQDSGDYIFMVRYTDGPLDSILVTLDSQISYIKHQVLFYDFLSVEAKNKPRVELSTHFLPIQDFSFSLDSSNYFINSQGRTVIEEKYRAYKQLNGSLK
jgi:hypothetical protein